MQEWFQIDLKEETRLETHSKAQIFNELVGLYLLVSGFTGIALYWMCVVWLWGPLSMMLLCVLSFLAIRNLFVYILPRSVLKMLHRKARSE